MRKTIGPRGGWQSNALAVLWAAFLCPAVATAQGTTGEVAGLVVDAAGRPVPMAGIAVPSLGIEVVTDADGRFFLTGLPVGVHLVRLSITGGPQLTAELRVSADARTRVELRSGAGAADDRTLRVTYAPLPLTSGATLSGDQLRALPVDDVREALRGETGVVETDAAAGPVVRGSRPGDAAVFVDGVPWRIAADRAFGLGIPLAGVEEVSILTGPMGPAFGDAQSGLISIVTRSGGPGFDGRVTAVSDQLFGRGTSVGFNRFDASAGGRFGRAFSVFAAASLQGEDALRRGAGTRDVRAFVPGAADTVVTSVGDPDPVAVTIPEFVQVSGSCDAADNFETACRGRALPYDWRTGHAGTVRADWRYGRGSGIAATVFVDRSQQRFWPGGLSFDPAAYMGSRRSASAFIAHWMQRLTEAVSVDVAVSRQAADLVSGVLDTAWEAGHRDPTMGIELDRMGFLVDFDRFSADTGAGAVTRLQSAGDWDQLVANVRTNTGTRVPFLDQNQLRLSQPYGMNPWAAATGLPTQGVDAGFTTLSEQRHWIARGYATWRLGASHRVRAGADWQSSELRWFRGPLLRQSFMDVFVERPRQTGVFGDVSFRIPSAVLEIGVRWDRFDPNTIFPVTPGRIFTHPNFDPDDPTDPADSVFAPARASSVVLPSVRAAWGPLPGTGIRAGVTRQARHPDESAVYGGKNADLAFTSTNALFGREADWPRTWLVELGVRQALGAAVTADVAAWLSTRDQDLSYSFRGFYDAAQGDSVNVLVTTNVETASAKGLDAGLTAQAGAWLEARVGYSYQDARETLGASSNRKHTLAGRIGIRAPADPGGGWLGTLVRGGELWTLFRVTSGLPYTRTVNGGLGTISPGIAGQVTEPLFASVTPAIRELDLRVLKRFTTGALRWSLVLDARNVLGFTNTRFVFTETGGTTNDSHRNLVVEPEVGRLAAEAGDRLVTITKNGQELTATDLRADCGTWSQGPANCVLLRRAEARWGDGDGLYDEEEQRVAFGAMYDLFFGPWTLRGTPRHLRLGIEITL